MLTALRTRMSQDTRFPPSRIQCIALRAAFLLRPSATPSLGRDARRGENFMGPNPLDDDHGAREPWVSAKRATAG